MHAVHCQGLFRREWDYRCCSNVHCWVCLQTEYLENSKLSVMNNDKQKKTTTTKVNMTIKSYSFFSYWQKIFLPVK